MALTETAPLQADRSKSGTMEAGHHPLHPDIVPEPLPERAPPH